MTKRALIFGIGGMDGSLLAELLLSNGYTVHGVYPFFESFKNLAHLEGKVTLHRGDVQDFGSITSILRTVCPHEVYNEADLDNVGWSHSVPQLSLDVTAGSVLRILEAIHQTSPDIRFFQPLSATMFGNPTSWPQNEDTPLNPLSPYACAKTYAYHLCRFYREKHNLFVSTGIFYNHDSERRSEGYLLHKICKGVVAISRGEQRTLLLGDLDTLVDIGCAREYVEGAWLSLQVDPPDDYVFSTELGLTIRNVVRYALSQVSLFDDVESYIESDPAFVALGKQPALVGDSSKSRRVLAWQPVYTVYGMIERLVEHYKQQV